MKWKSNLITISILVLLLQIAYFVDNNGHAIQIQTSQIKTSIITSTIDIDGNDEFDNYAINETLLGNGTAGSPYVISGAEINGFESIAVSIQNTNLHFIIQNSEIYGGTNGIFFHNVSNALVINNVIRNNSQNGVKIEESNFTKFESNNVYGNGEGACAGHSMLNQIKLNIHAGGGYYIDPSHNSTIVGNFIHDNYAAGIILEAATNVTITGNNITANGLCSFNGLNYLALSQTGINDGHGVIGYDVENVKIEINNIKNNSQYGVYLGNLSETSSVIQNNFENNSQPQQAYDNGTINTFNCNWWGVATTEHFIDGGSNKDICDTNSAIIIAEIQVPTSTIISSKSSETTSSSSDNSTSSSESEEIDNGDDGFLPYPMGLFSLVVVAFVYRKLKKGLKQSQ